MGRSGTPNSKKPPIWELCLAITALLTPHTAVLKPLLKNPLPTKMTLSSHDTAFKTDAFFQFSTAYYAA